jgi:predicted nucleotidyltransferase component of viral defense system
VIGKQDILDRVREWGLRADTVEKDYVLGWLLAAIGQHPRTKDAWVFKGGTCLKKCYFETYRFSEDLDFSLLPGAAYTAEALRDLLAAVAAMASEMSGITFPAAATTIKRRVIPSCQPDEWRKRSSPLL